MSFPFSICGIRKKKKAAGKPTRRSVGKKKSGKQQQPVVEKVGDGSLQITKAYAMQWLDLVAASEGEVAR